MSMKDELLNFGKLYLLLSALAIAFVLSKGQPLLPPIALITASYVAFLLPGWLLHRYLFPEPMPFTDRLTYSLAFGFVLLTTVVLYVNLLGLRITTLSALILLALLYSGLFRLCVKGINVEHEKHA